MDSVLGFVVGAEHVAAEREQLARVAVVEGLEGGQVAAPISDAAGHRREPRPQTQVLAGGVESFSM